MNILVFGKDGQLGKAFQSLFEDAYVSTQNQVQLIGRDQCDLGNPDAINVPPNDLDKPCSAMPLTIDPIACSRMPK